MPATRERAAGGVAALSNPIPSAGGAITRLAYARAKAAGAPLQPLLKNAGLTAGQVEDPGARVKVRDQIRFLNLVAEALEDDLLGFHLAQEPDLREFGLIYYVLASSDVLIDALQRAARYSSIVNEGISQRCIDARHVGVSFRYVGVSRHQDRHQIEFWMTAVVRACRQLTGLRLVPSHVRFNHHRGSRDGELAGFFGDDIQYGAGTDEILFPRDIRQSSVVSADPHLNRLLVAYCEEAISRRRSARGAFRSSVENALVPLLPHGRGRAGEVAGRLGVSERTLARRLSQEGLTFSSLLEALRSDLAARYLADDGLTISEIAWLLGYQEVGAFSHAFKRWTGRTPREARSGTADRPRAR